MVLLNTGLCLSPLEINTLIQGKSVVAAPKRFIVPGQRFALFPSQALDDASKAKLYRSEVVELFDKAYESTNSQILSWAKCDFCQHITGLDKIEALSHLTVWTREALTIHLRNKGNLFLAFLRIYKTPTSIGSIQSSDWNDINQLNKIIALPEYLNVSTENSVLTEDQFQDYKQVIIDLRVELSKIVLSEENSSTSNISVTQTEEQPIQEDNILDSPEWFTKIAEVGNSSDGNTFERLIRKSFLTLGFSNSGSYPEASLDPEKLGGSGGLDFYCDYPYPVVGECKATKTKKVKDDGYGPSAQLIKLGNKILGEHFQECIKLIVAAGTLTADAKKTAKGNRIHVLRPETVQRLIELKLTYPGSINLRNLKSALNQSTFSEESDTELNAFIDSIWEDLKLRSLLIEAVRGPGQQESKAVDVTLILGRFEILCDQNNVTGFNFQAEYKHQIQEVRDVLVELSSPLLGYLGHRITYNEEQFYFLRKLTVDT